MEIINDSQKKLELEYPCSWSYKLIGHEKEAIQKAIHDVILEREHTLNHSNNSKTGKYVSLNLALIIQNEDERNFIYEALKKHKHIKMVL
ncbi:MAG: putative lipoic acid-binding regulatory protein [Sulfurimonas sp.]|jgi:putative lipoic acid-binding regulatory protein|uniref:HP0495 family protein n=1 Tax=Sulfurimonas sp. TaxID=2022749 RepID=UPI0039E59FC1